ncbi:MAG: hypothetical protein Q4B26_01520 [Eubacteriales bacterium]|nr:hypothetical protein [Eubacteriales bacterium]
MSREVVITYLQTSSLVLFAAGGFFSVLAVVLFFRFRLIDAFRTFLDPDGKKRIKREEEKQEKQREKEERRESKKAERDSNGRKENRSDKKSVEYQKNNNDKKTEVLAAAKETEVLVEATTEVLHQEDENSVELSAAEKSKTGFRIIRDEIISEEE